jgi:predicted Zn-dependent peptidase
MCDPTKLLKNAKNPGVLHVLVDILNDLFKNGITQKELTDVKGNFRGNYLLGMEQSDTKCAYNGSEYILYDNPAVVPYERLFSTFYEGITKVDIHGVVRKYLRPENMMVCIVGEHVPSRAVVERYIRQFSV